MTIEGYRSQVPVRPSGPFEGMIHDKVNRLHQSPIKPIPFQDFIGSESALLVEIQKLERASAAGDLVATRDILRRWQEKSKDPQVSKARFASSFKFAMEGGHVDIAEYMIQQGVLMNQAHFAHAQEAKCYPFLELYLRYGFDINYKTTGSPPLAKAVREDDMMTRWLLDHGADPNVEDCKGRTPLSTAVAHASLDIIQLLFDHGGPESIRHGTLLWSGIGRPHADRLQVLQYLLDKGAESELNELIHHDRPDLIEDWIIGRETPLCAAARAGHLDIVKLFVARGADPSIPAADPSVRKDKGRLPIEEAEYYHHEDIVEYLASLSAESLTPDTAPSAKGRGNSRL
ncbi:MAG: hypothetical protein Q9222_001760 [Ikaeria aurantiellina]